MRFWILLQAVGAFASPSLREQSWIPPRQKVPRQGPTIGCSPLRKRRSSQYLMHHSDCYFEPGSGSASCLTTPLVHTLFEALNAHVESS